MLKMKKLLSLAILLSGFTFSTYAQEQVKKGRINRPGKDKKEIVKKSPEEFAKKLTEILDKELKFTDKQRKEVYKLQLDQAQHMKAKREESRKLRESSRKELSAHRDKFENILTPAQKEIWKNKIAKNKDSKFKRGGDGKRFEKRPMHQHRDSIKRVG